MPESEGCNGLGAQASQNGGKVVLKGSQKPKSNGPPPPCWQGKKGQLTFDLLLVLTGVSWLAAIWTCWRY